MYLQRKIDSILEDWKRNENRKPIIIKGSRQVGKTESIRHFANKHYKSVIEINFVEEPKYQMITADGYGTAEIIKNISRLDPSKKFIAGETLIFFDELQAFPQIATALKFFVQDGRFDVICSGSLLGINYRQIESNSVGYKIDVQMYSMDFEEFLWTKGYGDDFAEELLSSMQQLKPLSSLMMSVCDELFLDYTILGGMPAVVRQFTEKGTFEGSLELQRQLLADYKEDIRKYAEGMDQGRIINVFNSVPVQLAKENKKFQLSKIAHGARFKDYRGCIEWLYDAGVVNICYCMNFPELPLKGNYDPDKFKLYMADSGLLVAMLDEEAQDDLRANKNLGVYKGALYEHIVREALVNSGQQLYYYRTDDSTLGEDFFLRTANELLPVEVKSVGGKSKSLQTLIADKRYSDIQRGIKLYKGNIEYANNMYMFPYFCSFLLKKWLKTGM